MPRVVSEKTDFSAGQIDATARKDQSRPVYKAGLASARNYRILNSGAMKRRPGTRLQAVLANGKSIGIGYDSPAGDTFKVIFSHTQLDVYDSTNTLLQTITGCPWGSSIIDELYLDTGDQGKLLVAHHDFMTRVIEVSDAGVWSVSTFAFASSEGAGTAQPYWDYQAEGVTLTPSALTGAGITLTASAAHFDANHVGTDIRYLGREVLITAYTSATLVTGTVVQDLPPTVTVILGDSRGFLVDEEVQGEDSSAKGAISSISTLTGSGATFAAVANSHSLWDGGSNVSVTGGGSSYVSGSVGLVAHYQLSGSEKSLAATSVTVAAGVITAAVFPATEEGFKPYATGVTFTIATKKLTIVMQDGLTGFLNGEQLIGDGLSKSVIAVGPTAATPAAVLDWDEQAFSAVRGYPGGCKTHRGRLYLFDMRDIPRGVAASKAGYPTYFKVGAEDGDAIFEEVPEYKGQRVRHIVGADQGLILTDKASYFLPEFGKDVVTPSNFAPRFLEPIGAATPMPVATEQGFAFIENGSNRVIGIIEAGDQQHPWQCVDLTAYWSELMTGPRALGADIANSGWPERYAFAVNDDGSMAVARYLSAQSQVPLGWTVWDTDGAFRSVFTAGNSLFAICQRSFVGTPVWTLEEFDDSLWLDCAVDYTGAADTLTEYESSTVDVMLDHQFIGEYAVDGSGFLTDFVADDDAYTAGLDMITELEDLPPIIEHPAYVHGKRYGIPRAQVHVHDTSVYSVNGVLNPAYRTGEDVTELPTLRTEAKGFGIAGRASDLAVTITQTVPSPIEVLALTREVSF